MNLPAGLATMERTTQRDCKIKGAGTVALDGRLEQAVLVVFRIA